MSGHTPGPWTYRPVGDTEFRSPDSDDFCIVSPDMTCPGTVWGGSWKDGEANARLMAAAPDLLEALIECLTCEFAVTEKTAVAKAQAAIAKAAGEPA